MARLSQKDYWDSRYTLDGEPFDWYIRYSTSKVFRSLIKSTIRFSWPQHASYWALHCVLLILRSSLRRSLYVHFCNCKPSLISGTSWCREDQTDLMVAGAGTSRLVEELLADGLEFQSVYNIDYSQVCINKLNEAIILTFILLCLHHSALYFMNCF